MSKTAVIIGALRSPISLKNGALARTRIDDVCAQIIRELLSRSKVDPVDIGDHAMGCAFPEGCQGMLIARGVGMLAGLPATVPARVINRFCGSSMDAVHSVSRAIETGDINLGLASGLEDMFAVPMGGFNPDFHPKLAAEQYYIGMGETAENLAHELDISREDQEGFAVGSHIKALNALEQGFVHREVLSIKTKTGSFDKDEGPREVDWEKIRSLDPAFFEQGSVTAATSSPVSKGAAAVLLASENYAKKHKLKILARIVSRGIAGVEPTLMGSGPLPATEIALANAGLKMAEIDAIELNEAFAAQALYVLRKGNWNPDITNVFGGALALGHPLGASGARILCTLLNVLESKNLKNGLATMCIGGGQGISTIIENSQI
jgi:acetyl-CoA acyltransferase